MYKMKAREVSSEWGAEGRSEMIFELCIEE